MRDSRDLRAWLFEQSPDAIIFAGRDGVIREWNAAAGRPFGHSEAGACGQSLDLIIPEQFREAHWRSYAHTLAAGETKYSGQALPPRARRQDGSTIYVELTFAIIHAADGAVAGALAHARERDRRRRLRELEAQLNYGPGSTPAPRSDL